MTTLELSPRIDTLPQEDWHPRARYLGLTKEFGSVDPPILEELASRLEHSGTTEDLECAASALLEATIFSPNRSARTVHADIHKINHAEGLLRQAADRRWQDLEEGKYHPDDQSDAIRTETQLACMELYKDIIRGEITRDTRGQVFNQLVRWGRYTHRLSQIAEEGRSSAIGLTAEIAVLLGGLTEEEDIILPATPREDSGATGDRSLTHDFNYIAFDVHGDIGMSISLELKRLEDIRDLLEADKRYDVNRVVLMEAHNLGINKGSLDKIFNNHYDLTSATRFIFRPVREGVYQHIASALRRWAETSTTTSEDTSVGLSLAG